MHDLISMDTTDAGVVFNYDTSYGEVRITYKMHVAGTFKQSLMQPYVQVDPCINCDALDCDLLTKMQVAREVVEHHLTTDAAKHYEAIYRAQFKFPL